MKLFLSRKPCLRKTSENIFQPIWGLKNGASPQKKLLQQVSWDVENRY